jgi:hypothetical protein
MDVLDGLVSITLFVLDYKFHTQHRLVYRVRPEQGVLPESGLHHRSGLHSQIGGVVGELFQTALPGGGSVHLALSTHCGCGRDCE